MSAPITSFNGAPRVGGKARIAPSTASVLLAPFSTRLPPEPLRRVRVEAPQLEVRIGEITASALDAYLRERGY